MDAGPRVVSLHAASPEHGLRAEPIWYTALRAVELALGSSHCILQRGKVHSDLHMRKGNWNETTERA